MNQHIIQLKKTILAGLLGVALTWPMAQVQASDDAMNEAIEQAMDEIHQNPFWGVHGVDVVTREIFIKDEPLPADYFQKHVYRALQNLFLDNVGLRHFPLEILEIRTLVCLYLMNNQIQEIPQGINRLENLEKFNMSHNDLREISNDLAMCSKLYHVDLSYNQNLRNIDASNFPGFTLRQLYLSYTGIDNLPVKFESIYSTTLDQTPYANRHMFFDETFAIDSEVNYALLASNNSDIDQWLGFCRAIQQTGQGAELLPAVIAEIREKLKSNIKGKFQGALSYLAELPLPIEEEVSASFYINPNHLDIKPAHFKAMAELLRAFWFFGCVMDPHPQAPCLDLSELLCKTRKITFAMDPEFSIDQLSTVPAGDEGPLYRPAMRQYARENVVFAAFLNQILHPRWDVHFPEVKPQ